MELVLPIAHIVPKTALVLGEDLVLSTSVASATVTEGLVLAVTV